MSSFKKKSHIILSFSLKISVYKNQGIYGVYSRAWLANDLFIDKTFNELCIFLGRNIYFESNKSNLIGRTLLNFSFFLNKYFYLINHFKINQPLIWWRIEKKGFENQRIYFHGISFLLYFIYTFYLLIFRYSIRIHQWNCSKM